MFVAHPSVPANNLAEFVEWAKANRGKLSYSSYSRARRRTSSAFSSTKSSISISPTCPTAAPDCRPTAWSPAIRCSASRRSTLGAADRRRQAQGLRDHQRRALAGDDRRADLRRTRPSGVHRAGVVRPAGEERHAARSSTGSPRRRRTRTTIPRCASKLEAQGYEVSGETGPHSCSPTSRRSMARWGRLVKAAGFSAEDRGSTQ